MTDIKGAYGAYGAYGVNGVNGVNEADGAGGSAGVEGAYAADAAHAAYAANIDWERLRVRSRELMARAYAPYSGFPVGAAALVDDGRMVAGCNVENAAYGVALCAECGLVSELLATGGGRLTAFTCCDRGGAALMPCGRCRQLLWEHGGPELLVDTGTGARPLRELLPDAFGPAALRTG